MKKLILVATFLIASVATYAQIAIGARGNYGFYGGQSYGGAELSLQSPSSWELNLGWSQDLWQLTALKEFGLIKLGPIHTYAGFGPQVGFFEQWNSYGYSNGWYLNGALDLGAYMLIGPLQFGFDWRPEIGILNVPYNNYWASTMGLSLRLYLGGGKNRR